MSTPSATPGPKTRERILAAALALFAENGYDATSMRQIAEQLDITKAALYYHFDSKEDIVRALLSDISSQVGDLLEWARQATPAPGSGPVERRRFQCDALNRWTDIMQAHGITVFRFAMANRDAVHRISPDREGMIASITELYELLTGPGAGVEEQLRVRLALMCVNMAGFVGSGIDAPEAEILAAARRLATETLAGP